MNIDHTKIFATLGNETRLRCLYLAAQHGAVCVCEVVEALGIPQPAASKALKALREAGLVRDRRDANWIYYRLNDNMPQWAQQVVECTISELSRCDRFAADGLTLRRSRVRQQQACSYRPQPRAVIEHLE